MNCLAGIQLLRNLHTHTPFSHVHKHAHLHIGVKHAEQSDWMQVRANETPIHLPWRQGCVCACIFVLIMCLCYLFSCVSNL